MIHENTVLPRKALFNENGDIETHKRKMIGGNTTNLNDFNNMKYAWASDWYRQAMNNFWIPEEINMNTDVQDYRKLSVPEKTAYDKILSFLIFLDSIQTANLPNVGQYVNSSTQMVPRCLASEFASSANVVLLYAVLLLQNCLKKYFSETNVSCKIFLLEERL